MFGRYIHTYRFSQAVEGRGSYSTCATRPGISNSTSPRRRESISGSKPDPCGLTDLAKAELKQH